MKAVQTKILLFVILVLALGLRLWGINFGLPSANHPDEWQYVWEGLYLNSTGLDPQYWNNPPFYKYIFFGEFSAYYIVGSILGLFSSTGDFIARNQADPTILFLLGRITTALFGVGTVLAIYWLGSSLHRERTGFIAASLLSVCFIHVRDSHFAVNDIPATFFMTLALLASIKISQTGQRKWYILGGVFLGLGFSVKYSAAFAIIPLLLGHFFWWRTRNIVKPHLNLVWLALAGGITTIMAMPYFILRLSKVIQDIYTNLYIPGKYGHAGAMIDPAGGFIFYLKSLLWGMGWGLLALSLAGIALALVWRAQPKWILLSLVIPYYISFGNQLMFFARFILPVIPALILLAAWTLEEGASYLVKDRRLGNYLLAFILLIVSAEPLVKSIRLDELFTRPDTRTTARQWMSDNLPANSRIVLESFFLSRHSADTNMNLSPGSGKTFTVENTSDKGLSNQPVDWYSQQKFDYIVTNSFVKNIPRLDPAENKNKQSFYADLEQHYQLLKIFPSGQGVMESEFIYDEIYGPAFDMWHRAVLGPVVKIYQVKH